HSRIYRRSDYGSTKRKSYIWDKTKGQRFNEIATFVQCLVIALVVLRSLEAIHKEIGPLRRVSFWPGNRSSPDVLLPQNRGPNNRNNRFFLFWVPRCWVCCPQKQERIFRSAFP